MMLRKRCRDVSQKELKKLLHYNSNTGIFTWKVDISDKIKANTVAGGFSDGYILIRIHGVLYKAHILAWLYVEGYYPENDVDHIDRIKHHNWINNLREVSHQCNLRNSKVASNNTSGIKGVHWYGRKEVWTSHIKVNGKKLHLESFGNFDDAVLARYNKEVELNWKGCDSTSSAYTYLKSKGLIKPKVFKLKNTKRR